MKLEKRYYFYIPITARVTRYLTRKQLIAELDTRGAPKLRKFGNLSIGENLVMTLAYERTLTVQTLGKGDGSRESARRGRSTL